MHVASYRLHIPMNTLPSFTFTCENSSDIMTKNKNVVPKVLPHQDSYMNIHMYVNSSP
jgi:hypothetical protein